MVRVKQERGSQESRTRSGMLQPMFLSIPEVCDALRLSRAKVYRLIYYEGLPVVHFGRAVRVSVASLQDWVEQRAKSA